MYLSLKLLIWLLNVLSIFYAKFIIANKILTNSIIYE